MSLSVASARRTIEHTLGGVPEVPIYDLINEAGEFLVTMHQWKWLERQTFTLNLLANVPYARLPLNFPTEFRDIIAYDATQSLVNSLTLTSYDHLLELRTYQVQDVSFHYWGAVTRLPAEHPNLLLFTENFGNTATPNEANSTWLGHVSPCVVTPNQSVDVNTGETTLDELDDDNGAAVENVQQTVPAHLLEDGILSFSCELREGTATETAITVRTRQDEIRTSAVITWATRTIAVDATMTAGAGVHTASIVELGSGQVRVDVQMTYLKTAAVDNDFGADVRVEIRPAGHTAASTGTVFAGRAMLASLKVFPNANAAPTSPPEYKPVLRNQRPKGGAPVPVLALWPIPQADDSSGPLSIIYRAGWPFIDSDYDQISIPDWLNSYYRELLIEWARGREEEDNESLSVRLSRTMRPSDERGRGNLLLDAALKRDFEIQPDVGPLRGGAVASGMAAFDWGINTTVAGPS